MNKNYEVKPHYENIADWEFYASNIMTEYTQSIEEGLDIEKYKDIFAAVSELPKGEIKKKFGDVIFDIVMNAETKEGYPYIEPSDLEGIKALRKPYSYEKKTFENLEDRVHGAWLGRVCGCLLGKTVEGIRTNELIPFLKETGNYPMNRYILKSDLEKTDIKKFGYDFRYTCYADECDGMPSDDDTNYMVLYQEIVDNYGRGFSPYDVSRAWLRYQPKSAYCTAERVAFCNFVKGYEPPVSAVYKNPYREWIGAQIRGDYFGYINPGNPEIAAEMAWRDASVSHTKNGIYGEMFASAMIAAAPECDNVRDAILAGLAEVPHTSRLYSDVMSVISAYDNGTDGEKVFSLIHEKYDEYTAHGWCHTIPNAMIVAAALLYGEGDFRKSACMAVETGFDTDCNGATVGSVIGIMKGMGAIPEDFTKPINDTIYTNIFGLTEVKISERVKMTMKHIG